MLQRIGFPCKISQLDHNNVIRAIPEYNFKTTTRSWLNRQTETVITNKLLELLNHNLSALFCAIDYVGSLNNNQRMFRIGSDLFGFYTEPTFASFYHSLDVRNLIEAKLSIIGKHARDRDIRLSMHPGQFCAIVSDSPEVVDNSLSELEYHGDIIRWLGYGKTKLDFKLNVHLSGRNKMAGFNAVWNRMSPEVRNCLTLENDEYQTSIDDLIQLSDVTGIVLDLHHHYIYSGEYIDVSDDRIKKIIDSWHGVRPVVHYSVSREDILIGHSTANKPNLKILLEDGYKKATLRAHSDFMWNNALNEWARNHWEWADIMVEAKGKNLASVALYEAWK